MMRIRFLTWLAYRMNYYSGILIYLVYIGGYYYFWQAVYVGRDVLGGMDFTQMVTYLAAGWMARAFYYNNVDSEIAREVRDGTVAVRFTQPVSYLVSKMAMALGEGAFRLVFLSLPGLALAAMIFPVALPTDPLVWATWLASVVLAFVINTQIGALVGLTAFFVLNAEGVLRARRLTVDLLSGVFLPMSFFPESVQVVLAWLPFQGIAYLPGRIIIGAARSSEVLRISSLQLVWVVLLAVLLRLVWSRAIRHLEVQGG